MQKRSNKVLLASSLYLLALLMLFYSHHVFAEHNWIATALSYVPQYPFGILPIIFLLMALLSGRLVAVLTNIVSIGFWLIFLMGLAVPISPEARQKPDFRLMTYNIRSADIAPLSTKVENIVQQSPDVFVLQEVRPNVARKLAEIIPNWYWEEAGEVVIFSKKKIFNKRTHKMPGFNREILEVDTTAGGKQFKVVVVHLPAIQLYHRSSKRPQFGTFSDESIVRNKSIDIILEIVKTSKLPTIVAGDFNTPPRAPVYFRMQEKMIDSFAISGSGLGHSYSVLHPILRIDYVFLSGLRPVKTWLPDLKVSDHFPVVADLVVKK